MTWSSREISVRGCTSSTLVPARRSSNMLPQHCTSLGSYVGVGACVGVWVCAWVCGCVHGCACACEIKFPNPTLILPPSQTSFFLPFFSHRLCRAQCQKVCRQPDLPGCQSSGPGMVGLQTTKSDHEVTPLLESISQKELQLPHLCKRSMGVL